MTQRPPVSLIVPFLGDAGELEALLARLGALRVEPGDELIVADNRHSGEPETRGPVLLHPAGAVHTPGFARNRAAARAANPWLVFIDADTEPVADLIDSYFEPPPAPETAILAGAIRDILPAPTHGPPTLAARHSVARGHLDQQVTLGRKPFAYAQSANLAVRRDAFIAVGGFDERARAAEDADLCFRLAALGYGLESRPAALVSHHARPTLQAHLRQLARHGAGAAWCERRHRGSFPRPGSINLARRLAHSLRKALTARLRGRREEAAFALLEIPESLAFELGRLLPNRTGARIRI